LNYVADDGLSYGYQRGVRSAYRMVARREGDTCRLSVDILQAGWKPLRLRCVVYDGVSDVRLTVGETSSSIALAPHTWTFSGGALVCSMSAVTCIG
jgi:hypothetical protein